MSTERNRKITGRTRQSLISHPDRSLASRLTRMSLLEPAAREVGLRPIRWSMLLLLPLLVAGLVFAVREVAKVERVLAAEGSRAARVIVYELAPGGEIRVPIEPGTEVFRVVAHAVRKGSLANAPHDARVLFTAKGNLGTRSDDVRFAAPGTVTRVTAEDSGIAVGDPVAINVDVHGIGTGELTIALSSIDAADGVLLRVYRREALSHKELEFRPARLGLEGRARLAHHAGEVDWDELDEAEQHTLLSARWRRVAALPNANKGLATRAIAVAAPKAPVIEAPLDPATATWDLRADERAAFIAHGKTTLELSAEGDPDAKVLVTLRYVDGRVEQLEAKGKSSVPIADGEEVGIEAMRSSPGILALRAKDGGKIEAAGRVAAYRATKDRPVVVAAGPEGLVLRVTARRPVPRGAEGEFPVVLDATIAGSDPSVTPQTVTLRANRARSPFDRYEGKQPDAAPTTSAVFHLLVPPKGTLTLAATDVPVDVAVSELDPNANPRPVASYPAEKPTPKVTKVGDNDWGGFVARRPTNFAAFDDDGRFVVRVPHRFVSLKEPQTKAPSFRIKRPEAADAIVRSKRIFDPTTVTFEIDVPPGEALVLPVRLFAHEKMDVVAKVDGEIPDRRSIGAAERVTTARKIEVEDEVRSIVVLGDDLPPGKHLLTFVPPAGKKAWVHLPWMPKPRLPGAPPPDPHWIEGDLED